MNKLLATALVLALTGASASAQTIKTYDNRGLRTGEYTTQGNRTQFRDARGLNQGYSVQEGNVVKNYDARGLSAGRDVRDGNTIKHYDNRGLSTGTSRIER